MTNMVALVYAFAVFLIVLTVILALRLYKKFRCGYLADFLVFIVAYNLGGFLNLIGRHILHQFAGDTASLANILGNLSLALFTLPFVAVALYFFLSFTRQLIEEKLSNHFTIWYVLVWLIMMVLVLISIKIFTDTRDPGWVRIVFPVINTLVWLSYIGSLAILGYQTRWLYHPEKRRTIRIMVFVYLFLYLLLFLFTRNQISKNFDSPLFLAIVAAYFCFNIPTLFYLRWYLNKTYLSHTLTPDSDVSLAPFFIDYNISPREKDIVLLILKGRSNGAIARQLKISEGTVKNHLHNIYKKFAVNSRGKMIQLIRDTVAGIC